MKKSFFILAIILCVAACHKANVKTDATSEVSVIDSTAVDSTAVDSTVVDSTIVDSTVVDSIMVDNIA